MTTLIRGFSHVKLRPARFCTKNCASHLPTAPFNTKLSQNLFLGCIFTEQYQWSCLGFLQTKFTDNMNPLYRTSKMQRSCDENPNWRNLLLLFVLHRISFFTICQTLITKLICLSSNL